jgi:uncharacterized protein YqeY
MLMEKIREDMITARKGTDTVARNLLITLYSEAQAVGKNKRNGDTTDEEVVSMVKKFITNLEETVRLLEARNQDVHAQTHELEILRTFLPRQMTEQELTQVVQNLVTAHVGANMGQIMTQLKADHAGTYDGKMASQVVKSVLG